jgi:hypothetical protein
MKQVDTFGRPETAVAPAAITTPTCQEWWALNYDSLHQNCRSQHKRFLKMHDYQSKVICLPLHGSITVHAVRHGPTALALLLLVLDAHSNAVGCTSAARNTLIKLHVIRPCSMFLYCCCVLDVSAHLLKWPKLVFGPSLMDRKSVEHTLPHAPHAPQRCYKHINALFDS